MRRGRLLLAAVTASLAVLTQGTVAQGMPDGCALVRHTPDRFLNLRAFPTGSAAVVGKVKPNELLYISSAICEQQGARTVCNSDWTKVTSKWTAKSRVNMEGWVASRFLEYTDCHGGQVEKDKGRK